jgi:alkylated DNA repair dioxygenase AlkB
MRRLTLPGADVTYLERFALGAPPEELLARLHAEIPWRSESIVLWGRRYPQPRLIAWLGEAGAVYRYSGLSLEPVPWTPALQLVRRRVEHHLGVDFNAVLANYYRDHRDSMGFHSDDEPELGPQPILASLSLGAERVLRFRARPRAHGGSLRLSLASGSLLVMRGDTQRHWQHGVPKQARPCGARLNLTFRRILRSAP